VSASLSGQCHGGYHRGHSHDLVRGAFHLGLVLLKEIIITKAHVQGVAVGIIVMAILSVSFWMTSKPQGQLFQLAECDGRGWVTVRFPDGGEFMCTPTEQKPLDAQPNVKKFKRSKKMEKIEPVKPPEPSGSYPG
jgi:hypothetical protein